MKATDMNEKLYTETELKSAIHEAQTIQLLRLRNEIFERGGISQRDFDAAHFGGGFEDYERELAEREGISIA